MVPAVHMDTNDTPNQPVVWQRLRPGRIHGELLYLLTGVRLTFLSRHPFTDLTLGNAQHQHDPKQGRCPYDFPLVLLIWRTPQVVSTSRDWGISPTGFAGWHEDAENSKELAPALVRARPCSSAAQWYRDVRGHSWSSSADRSPCPSASGRCCS